MKKLLVLFLATLGLAACSTTNSNSLTANQASSESSEPQVCFYTQRVGWHFKLKNCMSKEAYESDKVSLMPINNQSQTNQHLSVDQLPHSGR
ncbi:lipoprotein [Kangiella sp.]|uniref:lipoprotein n=1 Tax=Kangiella sp. TaxID=1920245 RepID=UPI003A915748